MEKLTKENYQNSSINQEGQQKKNSIQNIISFIRENEMINVFRETLLEIVPLSAAGGGGCVGFLC